MMHVANVFYAACALSSSAAELLQQHPYISRGIQVTSPQNSVLEEVSLTLLLHSYLVAEFGIGAVAAHETYFPKVVQVTINAYDTGWLRRLTSARVSAAHAINTIAEKIRGA